MLCSALKLTVSAHTSAVYRRQHGYTRSAWSLGLFPGKARRPLLPRVYKRLGLTSELLSSILSSFNGTIQSQTKIYVSNLCHTIQLVELVLIVYQHRDSSTNNIRYTQSRAHHRETENFVLAHETGVFLSHLRCNRLLS